jgi:hypothetical protein
MSNEQIDAGRTPSAEWRLVEALCRSVLGTAHEPFVGIFESEGFSWGVFVEHLVRHKLQALAGRLLISNAYKGRIPGKMRDLLNDFRHLNAHRVRLLRSEAADISIAMEQAKVPHASRKGVVLDLSAYGDTNSRFFYDIDFMVPPALVDQIDAVMKGLGYSVGVFDLENTAIVPHTRAELLQYRMSPDHIPRYGKVIGDPIVRYIEVDFATSLSWHGSEYQIPVEAALSGALHNLLPGTDQRMVSFSPEMQLIDLSMHLFREAFLQSSIKTGNDVSLSAFLDIAMLWKRNAETYRDQAFVRLVDGLSLHKPMAWVLAHADGLWGTAMLDELGLRGLAGDDWLQSWRGPGGKPGRWTGSMRARLEAKSRAHLFVEQ